MKTVKQVVTKIFSLFPPGFFYGYKLVYFKNSELYRKGINSKQKIDQNKMPNRDVVLIKNLFNNQKLTRLNITSIQVFNRK